jgi:glyoxalase family protein
MHLQGIHHITAITADAQRNLDFYVGTLGLRFVKKTVNFDAPDVYHLYYGDETGAPGSILTFFEFPLAAPGRHGAGMIHAIEWRVASQAALDFWAQRITGSERVADDRLRFSDPEGLGIDLVVADGPALAAGADDIPADFALQGFHGARAYAIDPAASQQLLDGLGLAGDAAWTYDAAPAERGRPGAGTIHHIAWAARDEDHLAWQRRVAERGAQVTPVQDRTYFRSIYFREPSGVLFEIATLSPGFAIDEAPEHLGEALRLPPQHEHLRARLERRLTPLTDARRAGSVVM